VREKASHELRDTLRGKKLSLLGAIGFELLTGFQAQ
jgi:hypothetical protein